MTGLFLSRILLAPIRKVPSPPVVMTMSVHLTMRSVYSWFLFTVLISRVSATATSRDWKVKCLVYR